MQCYDTVFTNYYACSILLISARNGKWIRNTMRTNIWSKELPNVRCLPTTFLDYSLRMFPFNPSYFYLRRVGQPPDVSELAGVAAFCFIPLHFSFAFQFPLQRFLQCQLKNSAIAWVYFVVLIVHLFLTWLLVFKLHFGLVGIGLTVSCSWWFATLGLFVYTVFGPCSQTWTGFSIEAFSGLWEFLKLSVSSGVMLWYTS